MNRWSVAIAAALLGLGCGEVGPQGLPGIHGADGTDGVNGTNGAAGPKGDPGAVGDAGVPGPTRPTRLVDDRLGGWLPDNRAKLNALLLDKGLVSSSFDPRNRPVAVFDWDNTVVKNDIGDATFFWMLKHDKVLQPAGKDWSTTNPNLTADAKAALNAGCDALATAGQPLPTATNTACADAIFHIYYNAKTPAGLAAWTSEITLTTNQPYAWVSQLQAGYTPNEVRGFALAAFHQNNDAALGATQTVGSTTGVNGYLRIYRELEDLIGALDENGFDVWILTASPQYVVEPLAELIGIPANHVVGIRPTLDANGLITTTFQGCGLVADGNNALITFDEGKRCWINKAIFGVPASAQAMRQTDPAKRPVFVAGDSDTDIAMMKDGTTLKLAMNRNKTQLMCNAYAAIAKSGAASKWMVQPMFLAPKAKKSSAYTCSTAKDAAGVAIVDEDGLAMTDQQDTIFALP